MSEIGLAADSLDLKNTVESCRNEEKLVVLAKTNPQFFGELYACYYVRILNYVYRRTFNLALAEDITSNTFFKALRAFPDYGHRGKFGPWLYRIAGNEIKLCWRSRRRRRDGDPQRREDYARVRFAATEVAAAENIEEQIRQFARLHIALLRLPERYHTVLALRYFEGMSYEEVAEILEKKVGSVKSLIHRGLRLLRRQFYEDSATISHERHYHVREE